MRASVRLRLVLPTWSGRVWLGTWRKRNPSSSIEWFCYVGPSVLLISLPFEDFSVST